MITFWSASKRKPIASSDWFCLLSLSQISYYQHLHIHKPQPKHPSPHPLRLKMAQFTGEIMNCMLEPVCCKKWQNSSCQVTVLGKRGCGKVLNDTKLVLNEKEGPLTLKGQFGIIQRLFPKPVSWRTFFSTSYSKAALISDR